MIKDVRTGVAEAVRPRGGAGMDLHVEEFEW